MKTAFWFRLGLRRLRSSENFIVGVASRSGRFKELNQSQSVRTCMWFVYPSTSSSNSDNLVFTRSWDFEGVVRGVGRKWKRSDSSDSDSVALMTLLTTLIFYFHKVINALTTPLTTPTPTPSLVKTSRVDHVLFTWRQPRKTERKVRKHSSISGAAVYVFRFSGFINSKALWYTRMFSIFLSLWSRCNYFLNPGVHLTFERGFVFSSKREWSRCSSFLVSEKLRVESAFA